MILTLLLPLAYGGPMPKEAGLHELSVWVADRRITTTIVVPENQLAAPMIATLHYLAFRNPERFSDALPLARHPWVRKRWSSAGN